MTGQPIKQSALMALLRSKKDLCVYAYAQANGWHLIIKDARSTWLYVHDDESTYFFSMLEELGDYLSGIGVSHFLVDTSVLNEAPGDPAISERLREAEEVLADDEWMSQQIQEAVDDPRASIPNAVVKARAAARRAELQARLEKEKS
jgi:hypothetical protein